MKSPVAAVVFLVAFGCQVSWGQTPGDCKPSALNIPEAKYPCLYPDNRATFRVVAPDAQKVRVANRPGLRHDERARRHLDSHDDAAGRSAFITTRCRSTARSSRTRRRNLLRVRLAEQRHRNARTGRRLSTQHQDVPHGRVSQQWYFSKVTGKWRRAFVYTPPDYDSTPARAIPCCICCTGGEKTKRDGTGRARRRYSRQPDRGEESEADDRRDGQPERREARRERDAVRGARPRPAAVRRAARAAVTRHASGAWWPRQPVPARRAAALAARSAAPPTPR